MERSEADAKVGTTEDQFAGLRHYIESRTMGGRPVLLIVQIGKSGWHGMPSRMPTTVTTPLKLFS